MSPRSPRNRYATAIAAALGAALAALCAVGALTTAGAAPRGDFAAGYYSASQARAGGRFYALSCSRCHGARLEGVTAPPLAGPRIRGRWPISTLFGFVSKQMPADARGNLDPATYSAIVAFLLSRNGHSTGRTPLTAARAAKIDAKL